MMLKIDSCKLCRQAHCYIRAVTYVVNDRTAWFCTVEQYNKSQYTNRITQYPRTINSSAFSLPSKLISKGKSCNFVKYNLIFFFMARQLPVGQGSLNIEASRSHSNKPHLLGFPETTDRPIAETFT